MAPKKKPQPLSKPTRSKSSSSIPTKKKSSKSTPSTSQSEMEEDTTESTVKKKVSKHKSFGKFRCLTENVSAVDSGLDTEGEQLHSESHEGEVDLYDSILIASDSEAVDPVAMEYDNVEGESIEIIATEISHQLSDLHVYNEKDFYLEPTEEVLCEQEVEILHTGSDHELQGYTSGDESTNPQVEPFNKKQSKRKSSSNKTKTSKTTKAPKKNSTKTKKTNGDKKISDIADIRRSVRIKCKETSKDDIPKSSTQTKKTGILDSDTSNSSYVDNENVTDSSGLVLSGSGYESDHKPVKVKSRWRRSSELEMESKINANQSSEDGHEELEDPLKTFVHLRENLYLTSRVICKEAKKMACYCILTTEETARGERGCSEDCLNRLLMIECGTVCPVNDRCSNKKFQKCEYAPCEVFRSGKKGLGVRATADIPYGHFILEYVGEVIGPEEFEERATDYSRDQNPHHYFMALRADAVIDATAKGNISRFINHSCEPNAETQKWTVNGELRIGFFSKRIIQVGEEITFDYQFQRYGKDAQKCLCEAPTCRGWLGAEPEEEIDEEEEEEEDEIEEEIEQEEQQQIEPPAVVVEEPPKSVDIVEEDKPPVLEAEAIDAPPVLPTEIEEITMPDITPVVELPVPIEVKKILKKEKKKRKIIKRKVRKEIIFENVDVDGEIEMLVQSGLKNQAHTLKLSRLMVRATEVSQRSSLLRILRRGEFPCRRLFLDYHGLRLIYGWMNDAQQLCKTDKKRESLRLELLQTLATLPIPNKTMLQDSKVLPTVEKWSTKLDDTAIGLDSESNSPKTEMDCTSEVETPAPPIKEEPEKSKRTLLVSSEFQIEIRQTKDIRRSVGMDRDCRRMKGLVTRKRGNRLIKDIIDLFEDDLEEEAKKRDIKPDIDYEVEIIALALKLLEEWAVLKEVFKIPKKERVEQMKEHEREADRVYKGGAQSHPQHEEEKRSERASLYSRYRILKKSRNPKPDFPDKNRKPSKPDDKSDPNKNINKHERRKLFAMQVEQRDIWRQQELQRMSIGNSDPRFTQNMQCVWNQQTGQWQPVGVNQTSPTVAQNRFFNYNSPSVNNMPPPLLPNLAPQSNVTPFSPSPSVNISQLALNNISRTTQLQSTPNLNTNIQTLANLLTLSNIQQLSTISGLSNISQPPPSLSAGLSNTSSLSSITQPLGVQNTARVPIIQNVLGLSNAQAVSQETVLEEDVSQVKFAGPIPPPVKLPPKWKCAKDKYGRPYYYHIKIRISQWEPPEFPPASAIEYEEESDESVSVSSSSSSESSSTEESENDDDDDDEEDDGLAGNKLLLQISKKFQQDKSSPVIEARKPKPNLKLNLDDEIASECLEMSKTSLDERLQQEFKLISNSKDMSSQKRQGLVTDVYIISPRTEEDRILAKQNLRKYKHNKQRLKRQKELTIQEQTKNRSLKTQKPISRSKVKNLMDVNTDKAKKVKETFRTIMMNNMITILKSYKSNDCVQGKITTDEDFKHLTRKLTFFVMLKQLKNCNDIEELLCTDNVVSKAKGFVLKYMSKFGKTYIRPENDTEYY